MTNDEAYAVIAKHTFVAYRKYEGDRQIIVFCYKYRRGRVHSKKGV